MKKYLMAAKRWLNRYRYPVEAYYFDEDDGVLNFYVVCRGKTIRVTRDAHGVTDGLGITEHGVYCAIQRTL